MGYYGMFSADRFRGLAMVRCFYLNPTHFPVKWIAAHPLMRHPRDELISSRSRSVRGGESVLFLAPLMFPGYQLSLIHPIIFHPFCGNRYQPLLHPLSALEPASGHRFVSAEIVRKVRRKHQELGTRWRLRFLQTPYY